MTSHATQLALAPAAPARPPRPGQLRVITLNVQHAAAPRARAQAAWLAEQDTADVAVLTEIGHGPGRIALLEALEARGLHTLAPQPHPGDYGVVLAARAPLVPVPTRSEFLPHRLLAARVQIADRHATVAGIYVPSRGPRERRNQDKRAFQAAVAAALPALAARAGAAGPLVVAGDLNVLEPGHQPHHAVFGDWEYAFYRAFAAAGLTDAFRHLHPEALEHSWYGRSGAGYRFDHLFLSAAHAGDLAECGYLHAPCEQGLSDHAALTATLQLI